MPPSSNISGQSPHPPGTGATVDRWLTYLEALHPTEIDLGLDRVLMVLRRLFPRKPSARIITVAGTNGKGSAVASLEALLRAAGRRTGAYTSPHLESYNERVRLDGSDIDDASLVSAFERVEAARRNISLTYFEFGTLAAFVAFSEAEVEDWLLEVGLGGRLDAVNVLDADIAIITSVDIDHVAFLGDNREVIGFEKAGILRPKIPAVYADSDPPRSVLQQVAAQKVDLALAGRDYRLLDAEDGEGQVPARLVLDYQGWKVKLPNGPLPVPSVAAAVVALRVLEPGMDVSVIERTLECLKVPGRFEQMSANPDVFVDVGHNPHAAGWLAGRLAALKSANRRVLAVYAALGDKDVEGVFDAMKSVVDKWWLAGLDVPRGLSSDMLGDRAAGAGLSECRQAETVDAAITAAQASARPQDLIVIFGSFFTVAEARTRLTPISARRRLELFLDVDDRREIAPGLEVTDVLRSDASELYQAQLSRFRKSSGEADALVAMEGATLGVPLVACAFEYSFMDGTMGEVAGEKFVQAANVALDRHIPLVCFSASGGARVQEGFLALIQMAKTAAVLERMKQQGIPYISVITDLVYGEVSASLAMLGDLNIAEPDARSGASYPEVIQQVELEGLPDGFQGSQFLLERGAVDMILDRRQLRERIAHILAKFAGRDQPGRAEEISHP
ncbi:bifunctional tetrahydrofolate synthase/dihydrofolate synthase [Marinobacter sp. F4218]|uniref:bifunctional tetrahydrofolate synthase/dihydrofolate synthase n=1 Tax=Marinobacter sp. F4218 TaxID=2862868 RepID=UPI001C634A97|nr:bifunctional tetrahydrofolate synthase/dihydrofolate synthase [Marinobacter sp. F4218]MBW7469977.1 bifunctional tetrahydrofolate synthase/dihydrofolate synthase [Marinobacter sp. F4218]